MVGAEVAITAIGTADILEVCACVSVR